LVYKQRRSRRGGLGSIIKLLRRPGAKLDDNMGLGSVSGWVHGAALVNFLNMASNIFFSKKKSKCVEIFN